MRKVRMEENIKTPIKLVAAKFKLLLDIARPRPSSE